MSVIYGIISAVSLLLLVGYCAFMKKRDTWMMLLFGAVFVVNTGYLTLSMSDTLEKALWANRVAYLGSALLPLCMLMTIVNVCGLKYKKQFPWVLISISTVVFFIAASPGYADWYYKAVSISFENGVSTLVKDYGTLHIVYLIYLLSYFTMMVGTIAYAIVKKYITSASHATILASAVLGNIALWGIEQVIKTEFEFLSISYIITELFLLMLFIMLQGQTETDIQTEAPVARVSTTPEDVVGRYFTDGISTLTKTERKVYDLYVKGNSIKEVTEILGIKENTVKYHNKNLYAKLGVTSRKQLIEFANKYADNQ